MSLFMETLAFLELKLLGPLECVSVWVILASCTQLFCVLRVAAAVSLGPQCKATMHQYIMLAPMSPSLQASRDLVCFLQLDHVNVYYGQDYRSKYKAPTDYCLALKVRIHYYDWMEKSFCFLKLKIQCHENAFKATHTVCSIWTKHGQSVIFLSYIWI